MPLSLLTILLAGKSAGRKLQDFIDQWDGCNNIQFKETIKKMPNRINLKFLFTPAQYKKIENYEKKRLKNISNYLSIMYYLGKLF